MSEPKKHKTYSSSIGTTGEYDVWTACGLGDGGNRDTVEFEMAGTDKDVTCRNCLRVMKAQPKGANQ